MVMNELKALSLGLRARHPEAVFGRAALDITTGYGVDSFFSSSSQDPWARECIERFCDVLVHHSTVVYPVPDEMTLREEELELETPLLFSAVARGNEPMILPLRDTTAEDADLYDSEVEWLWNKFSEWTRTNNHAASLRLWLRLHDEARLRLTRRHTQPYIASRWQTLSTVTTREFVGATDDQLRYAFDTYARTVRYQRILGDSTLYFPHPLRRAVRARDEYTFDGMSWSWGRFLANAAKASTGHDSTWLVGQLAAIRGAAARAGVQDHWLTVARKPLTEQRDIVESIARDARLPAKLTLAAQRGANQMVQGAAAAGSLAAPLVSFAVGLTAVLLGGASDGTVPARVMEWPFLQGHLHWPELIKTGG